MRRIPPVVLAALSGLLLGLGVSVLLQQFAVWSLTVATLVVVPLVAAGVGAIVTWAVRRRAAVRA